MGSNHKAWSRALDQSATEFSATPLPLLSGEIPDQLRGTLYRNGPGRLSRGNTSVGHWFDGDGAILAVHFSQEGAMGVYRYVKTAGYQEEEKVDKYIYANYGMTASGGFWNNWLKGVKNTANTSVLALSDRLLALWEGGLPHALDLHTLQTKGVDNLAGLTNNQPFSAHPKIDYATGGILNFGISAGLNSKLNLYCCDSHGKLKRQNVYPLSGLPLIHDFVLAGQYLVFLISPVRINLLAVMLENKCFSDAMGWKPELGTQILIFDRDTLSLVSKSEAEPWYQWHFANGYQESDGLICLEFVGYQDFQTNKYLKEVAAGETQTPAKGTLRQLRLNPKTGKLLENTQLLDRSCEFPVICPQQVGQSWRYTYISMHKKETDLGKELLNAIACFDRQTGNLAVADVGENCYPTEPIYVSDPHDSEQAWIITVIYNGNTDSSEVRIYQSNALENEPLCRLGLPSVIPPSFHGTWKAGSS